VDEAAFMEEKLHNHPRGKKEDSGVPKHFAFERLISFAAQSPC
jgi:hypothetical protein